MVLIALSAWPQTASADAVGHWRPWQAEARAEVVYSSDMLLGGVRTYLGYVGGPKYGVNRWTWFWSAGAHLSLGTVENRACPEEAAPCPDGRRVVVGPEARLGLAAFRSAPDLYTYLAVAPVHVTAPPGVGLPEGGGTLALRAAYGFSWRGSWPYLYKRATTSSCDGGRCVGFFLLMLAPNSVEVTAELFRDEGTRWGGGLGWAF